MKFLASFALLSMLSLHPAAFGAAPPNEIRIQLAASPGSLDPAIADDDYASKVLGNTMDCLFGYDAKGKLENRLAEKITPKGTLRYEVKLRKGATWSDGTPITVDQFVAGIRRSLDPKTGSKVASLLFVLKGAKEYYSGKGAAEAVGVSAKGDVLTFELVKPTPYLAHLLTLSQAAPTRADVLAANGGKWPAVAPATGPYRIVSYQPEQDLRLEPNPKYWNAKPGALPVVLRIVPDESTAVSLFESGMLDVVGRIPPYDLKRFRDKGLVQSFPQAATYFLSFNAKKPPFDSAEARRAISGAVDRAGTVALLDSAHLPANGWIPPTLEGYVKGDAMAKKLAADAVKNAAGLKKFTAPISAAYSTNAVNGVVMERLQNDVEKKIGVKIGLSTMDWKAYVTAIRTDTPAIYRFQRGAAFMDPIWHLASFTGDDPNNPTGWKNAEYDRLVDRIASTPSGRVRAKLIAQAEKILVEDEAIVVPVYYPMVSHLVASRVEGFVMDPLNGIPFAKIRLKK